MVTKSTGDIYLCPIKLLCFIVKKFKICIFIQRTICAEGTEKEAKHKLLCDHQFREVFQIYLDKGKTCLCELWWGLKERVILLVEK